MTDIMTSIQNKWNLANSLKDQYDSAGGRPRLCQSWDSGDETRETMTYRWFGSGGQGFPAFHDAQPEVAQHARELLAEGTIAPGFINGFHGMFQTRSLKILEDLNWGMDENNSLVLFEFAFTPKYPDRVLRVEDADVIRHDDAYTGAIKQIRNRLNYKHATIDTPLSLSDGTIIKPLILDRRMIPVRDRQNAYTPS